MSAASGGCVMSAIVPCSFQYSREIKASTSFHGPKYVDLVNLFPGTFRFKQTSGFSPYKADNRHFIRRLSIRALDDTKANRFRFETPMRAVSASKQKRNPILDLDEDDSEDEDSDAEDNGFLDMEEWMKKKPAGFGAGKMYDTSLEDQLLEEIKRDQMAQDAVKNKKPTPPVKSAKKAGGDVPPDGVEVFVGNLPKKRNVERDIRAALRSVSGLLHIRPLVSGNEKTREPVCKGLAFLTFATLDDAEEFIDRYNGESIVFGKVEKKLSCELAKTSSPFKRAPGQPSNGPRLGVRDPLSGDFSSGTSSTTFSSDSSPSTATTVAVEGASEGRESSGLSPPSDSELVENSDGDSTFEEEDADLFVLEQQIWDELENDEDLELDMELEEEGEEEYESREARASSLSEETGSSTVSDFMVQDSHRVGSVSGSAPTSLPARSFRAETARRKEDRNDENEDDSRPQVSGQGFGRATNARESRGDMAVSKEKSGGALHEKEKKIKELEAKLEELQSQLSKRNSAEFSKANNAKDDVRERELKIESLEKRLLSRAKAGQRDSNVSNGKPTSPTGKPVAKKVQKNPTSAPEETSKDKRARPPARLKLGAASRLRKREREIFSEALSKYSAPSKD